MQPKYGVIWGASGTQCGPRSGGRLHLKADDGRAWDVVGLKTQAQLVCLVFSRWAVPRFSLCADVLPCYEFRCASAVHLLVNISDHPTAVGDTQLACTGLVVAPIPKTDGAESFSCVLSSPSMARRLSRSSCGDERVATWTRAPSHCASNKSLDEFVGHRHGSVASASDLEATSALRTESEFKAMSPPAPCSAQGSTHKSNPGQCATKISATAAYAG